MKKIMNDPRNIVDEMLEGLVYTHSDLVKRVEGFSVIHRNHEKSGKVALVSGGGSGHEPSHAGFVGQGMLSAAVCGAVFTSPTPDQILEAIKVSDEGEGVLLIVKNYSGDVMNFEMAQEMAEMEGINVESIIVDDDIAVEDSLYTQGKRGVAGTVLVHKILGYYADKGLSLKEIKEKAEHVVKHIHTIGIALTGVTTPEGGKESFTLENNQIEYGVGIHGEPGYRTEELKESKGLAEELFNKIKENFNHDAEYTYGILVNGLGGTPLMELYVFMNDVKLLSEKNELEIEFSKLGNLMTSLEMEGLSLTMIEFADTEWVEALNYSVNTIAW